MQTIDKIKNLIDSYFLGNTNLEQEEELRAYFTSSGIPTELKQYQAIFGYFTQEKDNDSQFNGFDDGIVPPPQSATKRNLAIWYVTTGIAAGLALLLTLVFGNKQSDMQNVVCEGTFVIVNGKCTNDLRKVSEIAIDAIDALLIPTDNNIVNDLDKLIENAQVIDEHIDVLQHLQIPDK